MRRPRRPSGPAEGSGNQPVTAAVQERRALVCFPVMPEFDRESGSSRIYDFLLFLRDAGWKVTFVSRLSIGRPERYVRLLERAGVTALPAQGDDISDLVRHGRFDVALLAFWHIAELYGPQIRSLSRRTQIIVDSVDLHFVRDARRAFMRPASGSSKGLFNASGEEIVRELNVYAEADAVLTVSHKEAELVNTLLGDRANAVDVPDCEDLPLSKRPFAARKGLVFVGNFRHAPNVDAVQYLCREIVPRLPPAVLDAHPLYVVGNEVNDDVRRATAGLQGVRLVGWVPSLVPYLEAARVAVVPLRYGAGTKRKLLQSLMLGTPSVSTTVGIEGLELTDGEHVLVGHDAAGFAAAILRLLDDETLWQRLASSGRTHVMEGHSRDVARRSFMSVVRSVLYSDLVWRIRAEVQALLPPDACVLVVSKGDPTLLDLGGRRGWHFPQTAEGAYAGGYPADGAAAIAHLEALRQRGAEYFVLPSTALWWLEHYEDFRLHLERHYQPVCDHRDTCLIFALRDSLVAAKAIEIEERRPQIIPVPRAAPARGRGGRVLVIGIYLANQKNTVEDTVARLSESRRWRVSQRWIALGGGPPSTEVEAVTVRRVDTVTPKFQLVNDLLASEDLSHYDYVLLADDDVVFPRAFVDHFVSLQRHFGFALAQPARTSRSFIDHPIVEQQRGSVARQTRFVEIGPVVSFHRSIFDLVFPFDLTSPMGWGYENVWAALLEKRKLTMGIIDAVPVDHSLRPPVSHYRWDDADRGRAELLRQHDAPSLQECFRVLRIFTSSEMSHEKTSLQPAH